MSEEKEQTLGEDLSAARQARGLDLEEVQRQTGISLSVLQGLEADQFDVVEPVFARLALKAYAEHLDLDPEPFLTRFDQQQVRTFQPRQRPAVLISQPVPRRSHKPLLVIGLVIACCALALAYYFFSEKMLSSSQAPAQAATTPTQAAAAPAQSQPETAPNKPLVAESSTELNAVDDTPASADTSATAIAAQITESAPVVLEIEARDSTWVQIRWDDAAENFEGIVPPGERHRFEARDHFVVLSTRPHGLRYWLNGRLLGGGQLGDRDQVLHFRAAADSIEFLRLDSQPSAEEAPDAQP